MWISEANFSIKTYFLIQNVKKINLHMCFIYLYEMFIKHAQNVQKALQKGLPEPS